jgi:ammonia channel protein AmtB
MFLLILKSFQYFSCGDLAGLVDVTPGVGAPGTRTWFTVTMGVVGDTLAMMGVQPKVNIY